MCLDSLSMSTCAMASALPQHRRLTAELFESTCDNYEEGALLQRERSQATEAQTGAQRAS